MSSSASSSSSSLSSLRLVKILYIEPVDDLHWNATVLEHLTKPLQRNGFVLDFTVCRDHLFALEQLNRVDYDIFMVHDGTSPLEPTKFTHTLRALGLTAPVVLVENTPSATDEALTYFASRLVKPVCQKEMCDVFFRILNDRNRS